MGQYWKFVNIDRKERLRNTGGLKLWEMLMNGCFEQLVDLLQKPKWIALSSGTQVQAKSRSDASTLLTLPREVIDMIVHELCSDSPESLICLSLTCAWFFRLLGLEFQKILAADSAPWAGHRLIFVGDYADGLDLGDICTSEELQHFEKCQEKWGDNPLYCMPEGIMRTRNEHTDAGGGWYEDGTGANTRRPGDLEELVKERLMLNDLSLFNRLANLARRPHLTTGHGAAVLRNLTAKQYVRDKAIAESDYAYSLGEVVAVFTTWTDDPSGLGGLDAQGLWAGHRFDIATIADVSEDGWTDVSELAVENLMKSTEREKKDGKRAGDTLVKDTSDDSSDDDSS
ncbi:hypothetical protein KVR01_001202 [Diaporthe batatas]|uniref:uncharacterized protein n=1 Tax=Diaporthe batatas TaxID=748121 RepID=UPI001D038B3C|nr:uncharacterized protein KVR01_001202 [Diaporthe batatas]KAG8168453.1 hypothetical protein KVR01_001202 [Diaporthe batatas]